MDMLLSSFFWVTLGQILMINILLSGDNAVVIALASRNLPAKQQKQAILFGSLGAIVLRVILTFFAVVLLSYPYLKIIGGVLLVWIGIQMLLTDDGEEKLDAHSGLWAAIKTIIIADFVMSLDNVLGVAAAAKGNTVLLVLGLVISIPLIVYGSTLILKLMERFGFIVVLGAGLLGWVAGEMLVTDPAITDWVETQARWAHTVTPVVAALLVVTTGMWMARRSREASPLAVAMTASGPAQTLVLPLAGISSRPTQSDQATNDHRVAVYTSHSPAQPSRLAGAELLAQASSPKIDANAIVICADAAPEEAPVGFRWISSPWRMLPDGTRDYAVLRGKHAFYRLTPDSSHIHRKPHL